MFPFVSAPPKLLSGLNSESRVALGEEAMLECQVHCTFFCHLYLVSLGWVLPSLQYQLAGQRETCRRRWRVSGGRAGGGEGKPVFIHHIKPCLATAGKAGERPQHCLQVDFLSLTKWVTDFLLPRVNTEDMLSGLHWAVEFEDITSSTSIAVHCK